MEHKILLDDIIYNLQKFGGASTCWRELTTRLDVIYGNAIYHTSGTKYTRLKSPNLPSRIFHSSYFRISSYKNAVNVVTVHDLIYERKLIAGIGSYINLHERKRAINNADILVCISNSTKSDLINFYGKMVDSKPIHVIHHGVNFSKDFIFSPIKSDSINFHPYFLFVGGRCNYKGFNLLLDAYLNSGLSNMGVKVICTGAPFSLSELELITSLGISHSILYAGNMKLQELNYLYKNAIALVYPSTYEGFGLPPLEAMSLGCPVICANSSSLPEVVGNAGLYIEPSSIDDLMDSMMLILNDDLRTKLVDLGYKQASKFSWDIASSKYSSIYNSLL